MRVFQFGFDGLPQNPHLPYNYEYNTVAYTGTHDNTTTLDWLYHLDGEAREKVLSYLSVREAWGQGGGGSPSVKAAMKEVMASVSRLAVLPMQDMCGYGGDTRTNVPGIPDGNWEYRTTFAAWEQVDYAYLLDLNRKYGRTNK
jgi:4-alpha-glucanotransferase